MGLGGVAIAVLPSVVHPKQSFSDRLGGEIEGVGNLSPQISRISLFLYKNI